MAQEFTIKSETIETKINQLLPTQGGFQPGVDFSASTMVVPIVDLTETAEGSTLRQDLQTAVSFNNATAFQVQNTTTTIINTTGFYRIVGGAVTPVSASSAAGQQCQIILNNGAADKIIWNLHTPQGTVSDQAAVSANVDIVIELPAGHSCKIKASAGAFFAGSHRQIADIDGNLT